MGYSWVDKGSASSLSFTYYGLVYQYDAPNNKLNLIGSSTATRTKDLVLVVNDLSKLEIVNNSFKIYLNYYKLR